MPRSPNRLLAPRPRRPRYGAGAASAADASPSVRIFKVSYTIVSDVSLRRVLMDVGAFAYRNAKWLFGVGFQSPAVVHEVDDDVDIAVVEYSIEIDPAGVGQYWKTLTAHLPTLDYYKPNTAHIVDENDDVV